MDKYDRQMEYILYRQPRKSRSTKVDAILPAHTTGWLRLSLRLGTIFGLRMAEGHGHELTVSGQFPSDGGGVRRSLKRTFASGSLGKKRSIQTWASSHRTGTSRNWGATVYAVLRPRVTVTITK